MSRLSESAPLDSEVQDDAAPSGVITGANSLWTRLIAVEASVAGLSNNNERTWDEIGKLRAAVHPMATSLTTLTLLTERAEDDRARLLASVESIARQLVPVIEKVAIQGTRVDEHIRDYRDEIEERTHIDTRHHAENQASLSKIENSLDRAVSRIVRVEVIYGFIGAAVVIFGFLATDAGRRLLHYLFPLVPPT
jgi:chromosome segregation ATPase